MHTPGVTGRGLGHARPSRHLPSPCYRGGVGGSPRLPPYNGAGTCPGDITRHSSLPTAPGTGVVWLPLRSGRAVQQYHCWNLERVFPERSPEAEWNPNGACAVGSGLPIRCAAGALARNIIVEALSRSRAEAKTRIPRARSAVDHIATSMYYRGIFPLNILGETDVRVSFQLLPFLEEWTHPDPLR